MNNTIPYKWPFYDKMIKADSAQIALKKNENDKSSCGSTPHSVLHCTGEVSIESFF